MKKINIVYVLVASMVLMFSMKSNAQISKAEIRATGLTCSMCSNAINKQLKSLPEVVNVETDLNTNTFTVTLKEGNELSPKVFKEKVEKAFQSLLENFQTHDVNLFHGVTASGKTEVYIKLIEEYITQEKQVLFLLPEIALTTQLVQRLTAYFGNQVAVFHSKYNSHERIVCSSISTKNDCPCSISS